MKTIRSMLCMLLACCLLAGVLPVAAAAEAPVYLALGDSISTGYGLAEKDPGFADQIAAAYPSYTYRNYAVNGNTAAGIYEQLLTGELDEDLAEAELITLTCGGNDLMAVLYVKIAALYNADHPAGPIASTEITDIFGGTHPTLKKEDLMDYSMAALKGLAASAEFEAGLLAYGEALSRVMTYIRQRNSHARVVIPTQYNPYKTFEFFPLLWDLYREIEPGVLLLNEVIRSRAEELQYTVAEVYEAFASSETNLCNANYVLFQGYDLDFHPNAQGHRVMAQVILERIAPPTQTIEAADPAAGTVTVSLTNGENALLAAAFYDAYGRLAGFTAVPVEARNGTMTLTADLTGEAVRLQIFLLSSKTNAPLCPAAEG